MNEDDEIINIDGFSITSIYIKMYFNECKLSVGTAFIYEYNKQLFLITNWHNVSGKNPDTNKHLSETLAEPNKINLYLNKNNKLGEWEIFSIDLYKEDEKVWLEHPSFAQKVDAVAIPIEIPSHLTYNPINNEAMQVDYVQDYKPVVGDDIFILGFPFALTASGYFPIWKRASIASEPEININDLPLFYVDTASRQGMSGSPVIVKKRRPITIMGDTKVSRHQSTLLGIYSGRIGDSSIEAQLGRVWKVSAIIDIIEQTT